MISERESGRPHAYGAQILDSPASIEFESSDFVAVGAGYMGRRMKRREDPRLIRGQASFVDDIRLPNMLYLGLKRSEIAHGRIVRVDVDAAARHPGVVLVMTGAELKRYLGTMPVGTPFPAPDHFCVTADKVRYVGDPVAIVVAEDRYIVQDVLDLIEVEIEPLPVVIDPEEALRGMPALVHEEFPDNLAVHIPAGTGVVGGVIIDDTAVDRAFADADVVVRQSMRNQRLAPNCMEPRGAVASWDAGKEHLTLWASTQMPHRARHVVAGMLGLGQGQVRVIAPEIGGGFGAKKLYAEEILVAFLARHLGYPVKWIEGRMEAFLATSHGRGISGNVEIAATRTGRVTGLRVRLVADIGAYEMLNSPVIPTMTHGMLSGCYDIPVIRTDLYEVLTNKTPTDAYRGAGRPEGIYFVERAMDMLADELGIDPAEIRRRNFIRPEQFPYLTQAGNRYDSGEYERCMAAALEAADWEALKRERDAARADGRLIGIGLSMYVEICGHAGWEYGSIKVRPDGAVIATTGAVPHGQGHETTFTQLVADQFGIPMTQVTLVHGDTDVVSDGIGTFGSRSQTVGGTVLLTMATRVKEKMRELARTLLASEGDLEFVDGMIREVGSPEKAISFGDVAAYAHQGRLLALRAGRRWPEGLHAGLAEEGFWEPQNATFPFGCHLSMVEIDRDTGELRLLKMLCVDDCGPIVNPLIAEGQIHGGLAQGIGQALFEEVVYDDSGQQVSGSFLDYAMPRATDFPWFELHNTVTPSPFIPLGTKGIGEAGTIGAAPCLVNAAVDALRDFGVRHLEMPLTAEKLWQIIHDSP